MIETTPRFGIWKNFCPTLFFLNLPLIGLWLFLLMKKKVKRREDVRRAFVLHVLFLSYFLLSQLFLYLSVWVVPYFMEPVLEILIRANTVVSIFLFCFLQVSAWRVSWNWFERSRLLVLTRNWFFPPPR